MHIAEDWKEYKIIATGDGYKLEQWKDVVLLRPDQMTFVKMTLEIGLRLPV